MRKKIVFFSCEPGGAEVLIPAIRYLNSIAQFDIFVAGYGFAAERFSAKKIKFDQVESLPEDCADFFACYQPDLLITSATSLPQRDMSEKWLWVAARLRGIPTLAFLDQWQNYSIRFSGVEPDQVRAFLPDYINCINEIGRKEMQAEGFPAERLVPFGHPYLSELQSSLAQIDIATLRERLKLNNAEKVVLFVSEAIREHYGSVRGYNQYAAFELVLRTLAKQDELGTLLVKLHPKDASDSFSAILKSWPACRVHVIHNEFNALECIAVSELVLGMSSIMLIEAYVLGKPVVSVQPGLVGPDPMILSRLGVIPRIEADLGHDLNDWLVQDRGSAVPFEFHFDQERFLRFVQTLLG